MPQNEAAEALVTLLEGVRAGEVSIGDAAARLQKLPYENLGFARVDHHRALRQGFPEVIYCPGKEPGHAAAIADSLAKAGGGFLATRAEEGHVKAILEAVPGAVFHRQARIVELAAKRAPLGRVAVCTAGTADIPVAEEAAVTAAACGCEVLRVYDVGVAGIHRLFARLPEIQTTR